ncbi:hypothetical protein L1987_15489 [Smallanthus sonchifolius]|uniref:Uncharacterized protein n=1 Tax=Smallanthus sonchifolius TaxID=185202 RepID=A0ACB9J6R2_9ASTR|nr:hypothetical protein L1987_15489 [Smallanthus sonchifolius]
MLIIYITTGGSSGIGHETARVLALRGAHVVMGVRNMAAGKQVQEAIVKEIPTAKVDAMELDLSSMASAHRITYPEGIRFHKINDEKQYSKYQAYGQSKLANILHTNELTRRLKGAATTCYVALHPQVKGVSGAYFSDSNLAKTTELAKDIDLAKRLWDFSMNLIK